MATPRTRGTATAADIVDERQEVIRGELVPKEAASFEHGSTQGLLFAALRGVHGHARAGRPGGWWLGTEVEIELEPHEIYVPDLSVWRIERVPEQPSGKPVRIRPDWVCEVLSPSTTRRNRGHKQRVYHRAGIGHYWLVEPLDGILGLPLVPGRLHAGRHRRGRRRDRGRDRARRALRRHRRRPGGHLHTVTHRGPGAAATPPHAERS